MKLTRREFLKYSAGTTGLILLNPPLKASASSPTSKTSKGVLVDTTRCAGCWSCYSGCKQSHHLPQTSRPDPEHPPRLDSKTWSTLYASKAGDKWLFAKRQCMHCEHPACVEACPVGALRKTPEGPVTYDEHKCIGCRYCMVACPFGVPTFEWEEPIPWIRKCDFCTDRVSAGLRPICVKACSTGALMFGDRETLITEAKNRISAQPDRYVDHVYGEKEAGGTSWLYISSVSAEGLGLPTLGSGQVTLNVQRAMGAVPPVLLGVAAAMSGIYWLVKRREKASPEKLPERVKQGVMK